MTKRIICIGGATIDRKIKSSQPLVWNTSNPVTSTTSFGGVARNVASNLAQLTTSIHMQTVVGNDGIGMQILTHLEQQGVNHADSLILSDLSTAHYYAILDSQGELTVALADMNIFNDIPFTDFTQSWSSWSQNDFIFLDTNLPSEILEYAIQQARIHQCTLFIDPVSVPKTKKLPHDLNGVFLIKPDINEAEALTGIKLNSLDDYLKAGETLLKRGIQNVVITLGAAGYVIVNPSIKKHFPAIPVTNRVDVSGAGDAFIAGIIFKLSQGDSIENACLAGAKLAAKTLTSTQSVNHAIHLSKENIHEPILF